MPQKLADALYAVITKELPALQQLTEEEASIALRPNGWTRKQELGHLIDSASNNHLRFVGGAIQEEFQGPKYAQNEWVKLHGYEELPWTSLVHFWFRYNALLVQVIQRIPPDKLGTKCTIGDDAPCTLGFLIDDYRDHMQHHLDQLIGGRT